ncbi:MAG: tetratricopeptide repeat protein, partial [Pseudomonadota bacterium]
GKANVQFQNVLKIDENHLPALIGLAEIAERRQNMKALLSLTQRIARLDPGNIDARARLGKFYMIGGDPAAALDQAEAALSRDPDHIGARALKAAILIKLGDRDQALALAQRVMIDDPGNPDAAAVVATAQANAGDYDGALAVIEEALAVDPTYAVLHIFRINILHNIDRPTEVLGAFESLVRGLPEVSAFRRAYAFELIRQDSLEDAEQQLRAIADLEPDSADAKLDVVRFLYETQGSEAAEQMLRDYILDDPENGALNLALVDFLRGEDRADAAFALLDRLEASKDQPLALRAKNKRAALLYADGSYQDARQILDAIVAADTSNVDAYIRRAALHIDQAAYDEAVGDLRAALGYNPDAFKASILMAAAFEQQGETAFAEAELVRAYEASGKEPVVASAFAKFLVRSKKLERAEQILVGALAAHPRNLETLSLLGRVRLDQQDWHGAQEVAKILQALNAGNAAPVAETLRLSALAGMDDYDGLIAALTARPEFAPLESRPLAALTDAYIEAGRATEAINTLKNVLSSDPDNYDARLLLARAHMATNAEAAAEAALINATDVDASRIEAFGALYNHYMVKGRQKDAAEIVKKGLSANPQSDAMGVLGADYLLSVGNREAAFTRYEALWARMPNDPIVANNFASLAGELRTDPETAQRAFEAAKILTDIDNPYFQDTLGWAHYRIGEYATAGGILEKASAGAPENGEILYHLGAAKVAAGDLASGAATLKTALEKGGQEFRFAGQAQELLEEIEAGGNEL